MGHRIENWNLGRAGDTLHRQSRTSRLLDFPAVLNTLSRFALSEPGQKACLGLEPYQDREALRQAMAALDQALQESQALKKSCQWFPDLEGVFDILKGDRSLDEDGLWAVRVVLEAARKVHARLSDISSEAAADLTKAVHEFVWPEKTWQGLNRCLDPEGGITDHSSPELLSVRQELRHIQKQCTKKVNEYLQQGKITEYLQDEYLTISADRYVLALKANFKGRVSGIIHDYSQTGETCYVEPLVLVELNNTLQELKQEEREARKRVLAYLSSLLRQELETIVWVYNWLVSMDVLLAKVRLARELDARTIDMGEEAPLRLRGARHPLLALESGSVQEVDIELGPGQKGLIISGGNSGGKTVSLKTLGLIALMARTGLPVPVSQASSLPFWTHLHVFLGDEQSLQEHLSTFTAQIESFQLAWPSMDRGTLVILDEFGAGTDPSQGAALAQAVIDCLMDRGVWVAAATHFPALKAYALARDEVRAASMLFDPKTKLPLYKIAYDQVGSSQALDVAREYGMPPEILERAAEYLLLDGDDSSTLLERLNRLAHDREQELKGLQAEKEAVAREKSRLKERMASELSRLENEVGATSREILQQWKEGRIGRKQALRKLGQTKKELQHRIQGSTPSKPESSALAWDDLYPGVVVLYPAWNKKGTVLDLDEKKHKIKIDLGGVNIWVEPGEISSTSSSEPATRVSQVQHRAQGAGSFVLDLRGQRIEEARSSVQRFLDQALLQGRNELEIIHGRGTGALRQVVQEVLQETHGVVNFELAPENRGGDGVTLVALR